MAMSKLQTQLEFISLDCPETNLCLQPGREHELGVADKVIQKILRHKDVKVTQACYIQPRDPAIADATWQAAEKQVSSEVSPQYLVQRYYGAHISWRLARCFGAFFRSLLAAG
jgi:hypothetical protein